VIRGNCVHGNDGPGIWADENVRGLVIEDNAVFDNSANGIMYEISYDGIIRNNKLADNGKRKSRWFWGPQILVSGSSNVQIYGNLVDVPAEYGNAITIVAQNRSPHPPAIGNQIYDNTIVLRGTKARVGAATDVAAYVTTVATKNAMRHNEYHVASLATPFWHWNNKDLSWNGIRSEGQEAGSTIDTILPSKRKLDCAFLGLQ
jgi:parallel beta-helix repeat protein